MSEKRKTLAERVRWTGGVMRDEWEFTLAGYRVVLKKVSETDTRWRLYLVNLGSQWEFRATDEQKAKRSAVVIVQGHIVRLSLEWKD